MAGRSVSVSLMANVAPFVSGMRTAAGSVGALERRINTASGAQRQAMQNTGRAATVMAVGLVGGFLLSVRASMRFEKQMSATGAAAQATAADMKKLADAALHAGRTTAFSATEAARGQEELVKAGVKVKDILGGGLKGALDLASAGQLEVGEAAEIAATAMTQFGLAGKDVPHIADLLAAGAGKAQGTVHNLGYAMKMGGLVASQFGLTVDETVGTLAAFASAGLIGSDSGTSFKTMLLHLAKPTNKASELMAELGINAYDAQGKFVGITGLAGQLSKGLKHLTQQQRDQALATIFGTDAIRGANVLYRLNADGLQRWINQTNDSGYAAKVASQKLNNLAGDLTKLKGAIDTALIQGGSSATTGLRGLTQAITGTVNAYSSLPRAVQGTLFGITGVTGAALLGAGALILITRTIREARVALVTLGLTSTRVAGLIAGMRLGLGATAAFLTGPWGVAFTLGIAALTTWWLTKKKATKATDEYVEAIKADSGALAENTRESVANALEKAGLLKIAQDLKISGAQVTSAVLGEGDAYERTIKPLNDYLDFLKKKRHSSVWSIKDSDAEIGRVTKLRDGIQEQSGSLDKSVESYKRVETAKKAASAKTDVETAKTEQSTIRIKDAIGAIDGLTEAQTKVVPAVHVHVSAEQKLIDVMYNAKKGAEGLKNTLDELAGKNIALDKSLIAQRQSVRDAVEASNSRIGISDQEKTALIGVAEANHDVLVKMRDAGKTGDQVVLKQKELTNQFIRTAQKMGATKAEVAFLANRYRQLTDATAVTSAVMGTWISKATSAASSAKRLANANGTGQHANEAYRASIQQSLPVLYAMTNGNATLKRQVDAVARANGLATGSTNISKKAFFAVAASMGHSAQKAKDLWKALQAIKSKRVGVIVTATGTWKTSTAGLSSSRIAQEFVGRAKGGPIPSLGPESSRAYDSVPAMLRVDEHVWTPEEVTAAGGHAAIYRLRSAALAGQLKGYAKGGAVSMSSPGVSSAAVNSAVLAPINAGFNSMISNIAQAFGIAWKKFAGSGGPVVQAARSQIGVPYSWGGGGPGGKSLGIGRGAGTVGFDCSGLTEYAWAQGRGVSIGGVTGSQIAGSKSIGEPRPGALGFPHPGHVVLASKPGYVIQAPRTGAFVNEGPSNRSYDWRWPNNGYALGGAVERLADRATSSNISDRDMALVRSLQIAGSGPRGSERHAAEIAPAGAMRLWAEPETGGEAYIPLAQSKRARSKAILANVASRFGMSVRGMANGGILSYADGGIDDNLNLSDILSTWNTAVNPATWSDVSDARATRKTQAGQVTTAQATLKKAQRARMDRIHAAEKRLARAKASTGTGKANRIEDAQEALKKAKRTDTVRAAEAKLRKEREDLATATKKLSDTEKRYQISKQSPSTQLGNALGLSIKSKGAFIKNLTTLSDRGFGDLARQLLAMGGTEAENIAASAVKLSNAKLTTLQNQVNTASTQQDTLNNLPNILTVRSAAAKLGAGASSWKAMLNATGLDPGSLATAVNLMSGDLGKTTAGKALLADMKTHGYASGGWIGGISGRDRNLIGATAGEFMIRQRQASKYGPLIEAINNDQVGNAMLRRYISGGSGGSQVARGGDGAAAPAINQTFNHPEISVPQLAREAAREAAWALG